MSKAILAIALLFALEMSAGLLAQVGVGSARVEVPLSVLFQVTDVGAASVTNGAPVRVSFNQASHLPGEVLRISVKADGDVALPGGPVIPALNISWTTSNIVNGTGINGVLSKTTYTPVFEGRVGAKTGRVDLTWTLALPPGILRAGTGQALLRWKFEAVIP